MTTKKRTKTTAETTKNPFMETGKKWNKKKVMDYICEKIETSSIGLQKILDQAKPVLPNRKTIKEWLAAEDENGENIYSAQYVRAHEAQQDFLGEELLDIADNQVGKPLIVDGEPIIVDGKIVKEIDSAAVAHAKLRSQNRMWLMERVKPKKYGNKTQTQHSLGTGFGEMLGDISGNSHGLPSDE